MKLTDGLFHKVFDEISVEYPDIEKDHLIIDIGTARLADTPEMFDVIVTLNLYGDIISDVAAQLTGSVGLGPSANIGDQYAMFEAIHGSAPTIAGKDIANPSALFLAGVMMLVYLGQKDVAERAHNAWLRTIEEGIHSPDIHKEGAGQKVGTKEFAEAVIQRLGQEPETLKPVRYQTAHASEQIRGLKPRTIAKKELVGVDIFVHWTKGKPEELANILQPTGNSSLKLQTITNRGVKVWPQGHAETFCTDHWQCRFISDVGAINHQQLLDVCTQINNAGIDFIKTENLYTFDGVPGFSLGQGQ